MKTIKNETGFNKICLILIKTEMQKSRKKEVELCRTTEYFGGY